MKAEPRIKQAERKHNKLNQRAADENISTTRDDIGAKRKLLFIGRENLEQADHTAENQLRSVLLFCPPQVREAMSKLFAITLGREQVQRGEDSFKWPKL